MIRLHIVAEGQTEEAFVNNIMVDHLGRFDILADVRCIETSHNKRKGRKFKGGIGSYHKAKKDLTLWMKEDQNPNVYFTTMFDLYALPNDFPKYQEAQKQQDPYTRVNALEIAFIEDIELNFTNKRFIPYIQLHEFEALLLSDPGKVDWQFIEHEQQIKKLIELSDSFISPELIDDGENTAPSKRIIKHIPEYEGAKTSAAPLIAEKIGLERMRDKCSHFHQWLTKLENLSQGNN